MSGIGSFTPIDQFSTPALRRMARDARDLRHEAAKRELARRDAETCFVCGDGMHEPRELHVFISTADAMREAAEHDARSSASLPSMSAVETLDPREAIIS